MVARVGEIVDFPRHLQVGKHGEKHRDCLAEAHAQRAADRVADRKCGLYMLIEEEHDPRRDGLAGFRQAAVDHAAHIMEVTGAEWSRNGYNALYVHGFVKKRLSGAARKAGPLASFPRSEGGRSGGRARMELPILRGSMKTGIVFALAALAGASGAQTFEGKALAQALRRGGYVIAMRHAGSPREAPDRQTANPDNLQRERQLDAEGRATAIAMGKALRDLKIPIGEVLSSPTYRALETVKYAQLGNARTYPELGDNGQSMQRGTEAQAAWLRERVKQFPKKTNTIIVTHAPNLTRAFPEPAQGLEDGEALIFGPDGKGEAALVARVKIGEWAKMSN